MVKHITRAAAVGAIVPLALALSALPGHAQTATGDVTVTGTATCNAETGHPTWTLHWTIANTVAIEIPSVRSNGSAHAEIATTPVAVQVDSAVESGLITNDITAGVAPNPIPADSSATATDGPVPNATGVITLTVSWSTEGDKGTSDATVRLDGTCVLVEPTTAAPTTAPPAVKQAVAAAPAFTG